jgi:hypothetical protein
MGSGNKIAFDGSSWMCKVILLLTLGLCFFLHGCEKDPPISSAESKSPDGKLVATAHTFANSGFGGGPPTTFVYPNWVTGSQSPTLILSLTGGSDAAVDKNVEMNWLNSTHLELNIKENQTVDFQAIKWRDVDVLLRDGKSEKTQTSPGVMTNEKRSLPERECLIRRAELRRPRAGRAQRPLVQSIMESAKTPGSSAAVPYEKPLPKGL